MTRWRETGLHSFFKTSQHKTGVHPFYIGMYLHIYTHIYVHIYTSQKECLHIFLWVSGCTDSLLGFLGLPARKSIAPLEFVSWRSTAMQRQWQQKAQGIRTLEA